LPSKRWGESPVALVVLKPGSERQTSGGIQRWANEQLSPSQRLATVELRDDLPKNHLGKILKMQLRQALQDALGTLD
jgi:acyl-coenzyme A synthetase/AMP-(fatty) acid ligase